MEEGWTHKYMHVFDSRAVLRSPCKSQRNSGYWQFHLIWCNSVDDHHSLAKLSFICPGNSVVSFSLVAAGLCFLLLPACRPKLSEQLWPHVAPPSSVCQSVCPTLWSRGRKGSLPVPSEYPNLSGRFPGNVMISFLISFLLSFLFSRWWTLQIRMAPLSFL